MFAWIVVAYWAALAACQTTTASLFLPQAYFPDVGFAASIIDACADETVYAIQCTTGQFDSTVTCNSNGPTFTVTEGPTKYIATTHTSFSSAYMTLIETCDISGDSAITCTQTRSVSTNFKTTSTTTTTTLSGPTIAEYYINQIPVTAGVSKLQSTSGTCSSDARAATTVAIGGLVAALVFTVALVL